MKFNNKIIIFSLLVLMLSISAASAHENIIIDEHGAITDNVVTIDHSDKWDVDLGNLDDGDWDDDSDDLDDDFDDWDDDDWDDDWDDDSDDWDDDDWDDDWDDDSDDWDDDDWDDDWDDDSDDWDDDDWDDDWDLIVDDVYDDVWDSYDGELSELDVNYTTSSIKFYKLISYYRDGPIIAYKTTSLDKNMDYGASSGSEDGYEDGYDYDSQEESDLNDLQSFMTTCLGASASFEIPDILSENHGSVSKSIDQSQNFLDDEKETSVDDGDDNDYNTVTTSSDNDLGILGLLISLLLCIILVI